MSCDVAHNAGDLVNKPYQSSTMPITHRKLWRWPKNQLLSGHLINMPFADGHGRGSCRPPRVSCIQRYTSWHLPVVSMTGSRSLTNTHTHTHRDNNVMKCVCACVRASTRALERTPHGREGRLRRLAVRISFCPFFSAKCQQLWLSGWWLFTHRHVPIVWPALPKSVLVVLCLRFLWRTFMQVACRNEHIDGRLTVTLMMV